MSSIVLKESTVKVKGGRVATTIKHNLFSRQSLLVLLGVFLFSIASIAQQTITLNVGGRSRQMMMYPAPSGDQNRPLVIWMHGQGGDITSVGRSTQFPAVARENNIHLVGPGAINGNWQL